MYMSNNSYREYKEMIQNVFKRHVQQLIFFAVPDFIFKFYEILKIPIFLLIF